MCVRMNEGQARELLDLPGEFSFADLKRSFRKQCFFAHPDQGGSSELFGRLQDAFYALKFKAFVPEEMAHKTIQGDFLSDLGKGLPLTVSAKDCDICKGKGYTSYHKVTYGYDDDDYAVTCSSCSGRGVFSYPCRACKGEGKLPNPKTGKLIIECPSCEGSGRFYPEVKKGEFIYNVAFKTIKGKRRKIYKCKTCKGWGEVLGKKKEIKDEKFTYSTCDYCGGVGEIRIYNPVIPRGLFCGKVE